MAENVGQLKEDWRPPPPPQPLAHIWGWFCELHQGRHYDDGKPAPISYQDISAWAQLTDRRLGPIELSTLRLLDQTYFAVKSGAAGGPVDVSETIKRGFKTMSDDKPKQGLKKQKPKNG